MAGCRSSGVLTASAIIFSGSCKLISIHAQLTDTAPVTVKVFDNTAGSGKELARIILAADANGVSPSCIEFDMHGVLCSTGLYLDISTGLSTGAAVSVEYA